MFLAVSFLKTDRTSLMHDTNQSFIAADCMKSLHTATTSSMSSRNICGVVEDTDEIIKRSADDGPIYDFCTSLEAGIFSRRIH